MVDEKTCNEMMRRLDGQAGDNKKRLNKHSDRLDKIEQELIGMKKDTNRLEEIMNDLKNAIEALNLTIASIQTKPLKRYEQITVTITTLIIGYIFAKLTS